jgi:hypothetical protein
LAQRLCSEVAVYRFALTIISPVYKGYHKMRLTLCRGFSPLPWNYNWRRASVELRKWDVGDKLAAQTAGSNQGPWHISMSPALSIALPDAYFDAIGLPRLSDQRKA